MMGFVQDAPPIVDRFEPLDLPFVVDCCMLPNILLIKSPSKKMGSVRCRDGNVVSPESNFSSTF